MEGLLSMGTTPSSLIASTWPENTKAAAALTSEKVITLLQSNHTKRIISIVHFDVN